jgi:methionyl-tRNA formyltransferase
LNHHEMPMKIVFWGTPEFAVPSLVALLDHGDFEVMGVVTQPDKRRGRGNELSPSPVKQLALERGLTVWQPKSVKKDAETLAQLRDCKADCFVVVAYGQILSQEILDMPRYGCVNGHGSILPKYRGAAPIQWSIVRGETETGMTTMQMDIGMDTGAMLLTGRVPIGLLDNAHDLANQLSTLGAELILTTLPQLGKLQPIPQVEADATYAPLIRKADYELDWRKSAIELHNKIRGFYPSCVTVFRETPLKVLATLPLGAALPAEFAGLPAMVADLTADSAPESPPGTIVALLKNHGAVVQTGDGLLLLREVQPAGKRAQSGWDFVNGLRVTLGERLGGSP